MFLIENSFIKEGCLENKTRKVTASVYILSITETANVVQQTVLLDLDNYILSLIWVFDSMYICESRNKDENGNLSSSGTAVLLKLETLYAL